MSSPADRPVAALVRWLMRPAQRVASVLGVCLLASAFATVDASHRTRGLFTELDAMRIERDGLLAQRGRLLLERSTFSAYNRVESVAVDQLGMRMPEPSETRLVRP
ncbi:MAG TPA: cell division protein FtsL [Pseudomonadales bacterium]|nr:cell division protein FtsL [Pseudomonadales bacterium]